MAKNSSDHSSLARSHWAATRFLLLAVISILFLDRSSNFAFAQRQQAQTDLSNEIRVEEPEQKITQLIERAKVAATDQQWDETLDLYASVIEQAGDQIVRLDAGKVEHAARYITVREFCQRQIAVAPDALRTRYRARYDAHAQKLYEDGIARHDRAKLQSVVDDFFLTSVGDDAIFALGELSLEKGDASFARQCWERLRPRDDPLIFRYPDSKLAPVEIRARIVLALLAERNRDQLKIAVEQLKKDFPTQTGRLGAKSGVWHELLQAQIDADAESEKNAAAERLAASEKGKNHAIANVANQSSTFAANPARTGHYSLAASVNLKKATWQNPITISSKYQFDPRFAQMMGYNLQKQRTGERHLAIHPLIARGKVFYADEERIYAYDLKTGQPAWPSEQRTPGEIYASNLPNAKQPEYDPDQVLGRFEVQEGKDPVKIEPGAKRYRTLGSMPHFTLTVQGKFLLARIGSPITVPSRNFNTPQPNQVVCLNLDRQGLEQWSVKPPDERWSFEGTPIADEDHVYALLRSNDIRPQVHMICYDLQTGSQQWRRMICGGEMPGKGAIDEITCLLPTLAEGRIYVATNLGAVAAIDATSGRIVWISQYKRAAKFDDAAHWSRDLSPPIYFRGVIYVAPQDSPSVFAIDAASGMQLWDYHQRKLDEKRLLLPMTILHLLGPTDDGRHLIGTGLKTITWIDLNTAKSDDELSDGSVIAGRGILADGKIILPGQITMAIHPQNYVPKKLDSLTNPEKTVSYVHQSESKDALKATLVANESQLIIATPEKIWSLGTDEK